MLLQLYFPCISDDVRVDRQLVQPLKLTTHGYNTPYEALRDKAQSILTQIVAHRTYTLSSLFSELALTTLLALTVDYSSMVKQRSIGPDNLHEGDEDQASAFLDALRTKGMLFHCSIA